MLCIVRAHCCVIRDRSAVWPAALSGDPAYKGNGMAPLTSLTYVRILAVVPRSPGPSVLRSLWVIHAAMLRLTDKMSLHDWLLLEKKSSNGLQLSGTNALLAMGDTSPMYRLTGVRLEVKLSFSNFRLVVAGGGFSVFTCT